MITSYSGESMRFYYLRHNGYVIMRGFASEKAAKDDLYARGLVFNGPPRQLKVNQVLMMECVGDITA